MTIPTLFVVCGSILLICVIYLFTDWLKNRFSKASDIEEERMADETFRVGGSG